MKTFLLTSLKKSFHFNQVKLAITVFWMPSTALPAGTKVAEYCTATVLFCFHSYYFLQILPGGTEQGNTSTLQMPNLFSIDGNQFFRCTSDNGIPPAAVVEAYVEDLRYPDGSKFVTLPPCVRPLKAVLMGHGHLPLRLYTPAFIGKLVYYQRYRPGGGYCINEGVFCQGVHFV